VETCQAERGTLAVCIREAQRTLAQSSKRLIEGKIASLGLGRGFKLFNDKIETPGDGLIIFRGMQDHTAESMKSLEGFRIAWIDEAQTLSARSLALLRPTIRAPDSEVWASWNPYNVPLGAGFDYWAPSAPNSCFALPYGQAISRTAYATLFALFGTTYGGGDGSTTFNLPDLRGRVAIAADNMGGSQAGRVNAVLGNGLGAVGGEQQHTLTIGEIPAHNHGATINDPGHTHAANNISGFVGSGIYGPATNGGSYEQPLSLQYAMTGISVAIGNNGGGAAHNNLQPSIVCNYIIRII
jgi:microcystin-dependent protein